MKCNICFEACSKPYVTTCGHIFCRDHILQWLKNNNTCPVCRTHLPHRKEKGLVEIFTDEIKPNSTEILQAIARGHPISADEKESGEINPMREVGMLQTLSAMSKQWEQTLFELVDLRSKVGNYEEENKRLRMEIKKLKHALHSGGGGGGKGGVRFLSGTCILSPT